MFFIHPRKRDSKTQIALRIDSELLAAQKPMGKCYETSVGGEFLPKVMRVH